MTERPPWEGSRRYRAAARPRRMAVSGARVEHVQQQQRRLVLLPDAKARHTRELSRQRAAAALTDMEERPLGRSFGKRKSR